MEYKKTLATVFASLTFLTSAKISANPPSDCIGSQTFDGSYSGAFWPIVVATSATLCAVSGYIGYRLGKNLHFSRKKEPKNLNLDKEIALVGSTNEDPTITPEGVNRFELLAIDYIDKLLNIDIPKLKTAEEFPAQYLANVRGICYPVPHALENIATKKGCRTAYGLALKLKNKRLILQQIVENEEKITVGYLISLLNEMKSLLQEAVPIIEENYYS